MVDMIIVNLTMAYFMGEFEATMAFVSSTDHITEDEIIDFAATQIGHYTTWHLGLYYVVLVAFQVLFIAGFGATPGKFMAGTAVVPTGSAGLEVRPSPWDSVKRAILKTSLWAFGSFFFAGVIFGDKLGIYDRMSGTEVVSIHKPEKAGVVRSFLYALVTSCVCLFGVYLFIISADKTLTLTLG